MNNSRLKIKYYNKIIYDLKNKMKYKSIMQVPKLKKICINQGIGLIINKK